MEAIWGDSFLYQEDFGLQWESAAIVKPDGVETLSTRFMKLIEL